MLTPDELSPEYLYAVQEIATSTFKKCDDLDRLEYVIAALQEILDFGRKQQGTLVVSDKESIENIFIALSGFGFDPEPDNYL